MNSLTERITEAERRIKNRTATSQDTGNAALVERIQRLEVENRRLKHGKNADTQRAAADNGGAEEK